MNTTTAETVTTTTMTLPKSYTVNGTEIRLMPAGGWIITRPAGNGRTATTRSIAGAWASPHGDWAYIWMSPQGDIFPGILDEDTSGILEVRWADLLRVMTPMRPAGRRERDFVPDATQRGRGFETCFWGSAFWYRLDGTDNEWEEVSVTEYSAMRVEQEGVYCASVDWL